MDMLTNNDFLNITQIESEIFGRTKHITSKNDEYIKIVDKFVEEISLNDHKRLFISLVRYIPPFNNIVCDIKGRPVKISEINSILNFNDININTQYLEPLVEQNMLYIVLNHSGEEFCVINPKVAYCREFLPQEIVQLFGSNVKYNSEKQKVVKSRLTFRKEKSLEKHLVENMNLIEDGMSLVKTQYEIDGGFIDILAIDKFGTKCIVELKVTPDDRSLVFQSVYYPSHFEEKVRMITICPNYSKRIYRSLKLLNNVEIKQYIVENDLLIIKDFKIIT
jgi:hypothetical protein